jgi:pimeloyl-ACP methyl ester carboxylesterase
MMRCGPLWSMVIVGGLLGERRLARLRHLLPRRGDSRLARLDGAIAGHIMSSERLGPVAVARSIGPHPTASGCTSSTLRACGGGPLGIKRVSEVVPGIGRSERKPERSVIDWPSDVAELATALRLERFAVAGHSAGGAYVLACAERLRDAVSEAARLRPGPPSRSAGGTGRTRDRALLGACSTQARRSASGLPAARRRPPHCPPSRGPEISARVGTSGSGCAFRRRRASSLPSIRPRGDAPGAPWVRRGHACAAAALGSRRVSHRRWRPPLARRSRRPRGASVHQPLRREDHGRESDLR